MPGRLAVAIALVIVVAGCSAPSGDPSTATVTPAPLPTGTAVAPPGMTASGVAEPLVLARAHAATLSGTSFTYRATVIVRSANGTRIGTIRTVHRVDADRFVHEMRVDGRVPDAITRIRAVDAYSNGSVTVIRYRIDGETRTLVSARGTQPLSAFNVVGKGRLYTALVATEPTVWETTIRDGTRFYRLRGTAPSLTIGARRVANATFEAVVAPSGLVRRYTLAYDVNVTGSQAWSGRVVRRVRYDDLGTTEVERPAWVAGEVANATEVPPGR